MGECCHRTCWLSTGKEVSNQPDIEQGGLPKEGMPTLSPEEGRGHSKVGTSETRHGGNERLWFVGGFASCALEVPRDKTGEASRSHSGHLGFCCVWGL